MTTSSTTHPQSHDKRTHLSLLLECLGEAAHVGGKVALVAEELDVGTIDHELAGLALGNVLVAGERGEAPVLRNDDLLATRELEDLLVSCTALGRNANLPCTGIA